MDDIKDLISWLSEHEKSRNTPEEEHQEVLLNPEPRRKRGRPRKITYKFKRADKQRRFEELGGLCEYCGKPIEGQYHAHHKVMKSQGGSGDIDNMMILHKECHMDPAIFKELHNGMELPGKWGYK